MTDKNKTGLNGQGSDQRVMDKYLKFIRLSPYIVLYTFCLERDGALVIPFVDFQTSSGSLIWFLRWGLLFQYLVFRDGNALGYKIKD